MHLHSLLPAYLLTPKDQQQFCVVSKRYACALSATYLHQKISSSSVLSAKDMHNASALSATSLCQKISSHKLDKRTIQGLDIAGLIEY